MLTYRHTDTLEVVVLVIMIMQAAWMRKILLLVISLMMAEGVVSWKSVKQTLTTSSTMEVEYVVCFESTCHAIWLRNFISTLEVVHSISRPLKLFCDNSAVVSFSRITRSTSLSKHIDEKFFLLKRKL